MKSFLLFFSVILLFSCANKQEIKREYFILQQEVHSYNFQFGRMMETHFDFKEYIGDKSRQSDVLSAIGEINDLHQSIVDTITERITEIELLKENMLMEAKIYFKSQDLGKSSMSLSDRKHFWNNPRLALNSSYSSQIEELQIKMKKTRKWIFEEICRYHTDRSMYRGDYRQFKYKEPNIEYFDDEKKCNTKLNKALKDVAPDDAEAFRKVYFALSKDNLFLDKGAAYLMENQSLLQNLNVLTVAQKKLMEANADLATLLRCYFTGCFDFVFTKFFVNVDGPEAVLEGDSVELKLFYTFYDSYQKPVLYLDKNLKNIQVQQKEGITYLRFKANESQKIKGTLTLHRNYGVPKTLPWEKSIKVLKQK